MSETIHRLRTTHAATRHILAGHDGVVEFTKEEGDTYLSEPIPEAVAVENAQIPHFTLVIDGDAPFGVSPLEPADDDTTNTTDEGESTEEGSESGTLPLESGEPAALVQDVASAEAAAPTKQKSRGGR
jgi:hypothetical protein